MKKKTHTAIHNVSIKILCVWAQVNGIFHELPPSLANTYKRLRASNDYKFNGGNTYEQKLLDAVKNVKVRRGDMRELSCTLVNKSCTTTSLKGTKSSSKKAMSSSSSSSESSPESSSDTGALFMTANNGEAPSDNMKQTDITSFMRDKSLSNGMGDSLLRTPSAIVRNSLHMTDVVVSYDKVLKMLLRGEGYGKSSCNQFYLALTATYDRRDAVLARMKVLLALCKAAIDVKGEDRSCEEACGELIDSEVLHPLHCTFASRSNQDDADRIRSDGYCFYRCLFQLHVRCNSKFTRTMEQMVASDKNCNTVETTNSSQGFQNFLSQLSTSTIHREGLLSAADEDAFSAVVVLVHAFSVLSPGKPLSIEEWGNSAWVETLKFPCASFTVIPENDSVLAERLYTEDDGRPTDQWSQLTYISQVEKPGKPITVGDVLKVTQNCNFFTFATGHFSLIDNPEDGADIVTSMLTGMCAELIGSMLLISLEKLTTLHDRVGLIVTSMENNEPCSVTEEFDFKEFQGLMMSAKPRVVTDGMPPVVSPDSVIDLSLYDDDDDDDNCNEASPANSEKLIKRLRAQVFLIHINAQTVSPDDVSCLFTDQKAGQGD